MSIYDASDETVTPANPTAGRLKLYSKAGVWYYLNSAGVEVALSSASTTVSKTSATGSAILPAGTTAQRDGTPADGYTRYNSTLTALETWYSSAWNALATSDSVSLKANLAGSTTQPFSASTINEATIPTPNAVLNPNFDIAQRGTSFVSAASAAYDLDGWLTNYVSAAVLDVVQGVGPTTGSYSRQCTVTTADASIAASDFLMAQLKLTGYDIVNYALVGNTFTVAFKAKFPLTGIHCVVLKNSGSDRCYVHEITVAAANTWAVYQFTVSGGLPIDGTWNYTTGIGLRLQVSNACGSTLQTASVDQWVTGNYMGTANQVNDLATIGNVWAIADVKINRGTQPTSASVSRTEMLVRCKERYNRLGGYAANDLVIAGYNVTGQPVTATLGYPEMLYVPTATKVGTWTVSNMSQPTIGGVGKGSLGVNASITSTGNGYTQTPSSSTYIDLNADL